jgi:cytochrome c biogenesis protein CcmG/thiol:disulfide interchange protein DsbE
LVIVNGVALTLEEFGQLRAIDATMAGLAGHTPSAPGLLLEQWINGELARQQAAQMASAPVDSVDALDAFLARTGRSRADLDAALAAAQVTPAAFDDYWQRLILADQFVRAAAAAQGLAAADVVRSLQQAARISFGTAASSLFATPVAAAAGDTPAADASAATPPAAADAPTADARAADAATVAAATSAATPATTPAAVRGIETGMLAPEFALGALNVVSPTLSLAELQGKPAVLVFWTTWCPYCLRQTPLMVEAYPRAAEAGIQFVGIDVQEERNTVATYLAQHQIDYPILLDEQGSIAAQYAVQGYPTTYFLDSDGRIVARNVGALTGEQLNTYLQMLGSPGPGP